jgi:ABC-type phosphate transport system substrate-binding protein
MKIMKAISLLSSSALALLTVISAHAQNVSTVRLAVVVNTKNPTQNVSNEVVGDLYLRRATHFPNANEVTLIDQPVNSSLYEEFYRTLTNKTPGQVQSYWSRLVFTGKGRPPRQAASSAEVKRIVNANSNSIGYVEESTIDKTVKPILIIVK